MTPIRRTVTVAACSVVAALVAPATAWADLFGVTVTDGSETVSVTGSSLFDLAENVINQQGEFARFENTDFVGSLDYANLESAIIVSSSAADDMVRVQIPSIGFDRTFSDEDEAEEFLRNEGADVVADFISVVNQQTLIGVTDGNPAALTATLADDAFRNFGEFRNPFVTYTQGGDASRLYFSAASIQTDVGDGTLYEGALTGSLQFTERVALVFSTPFTYREIEESQTFSLGTQIGLPIKLTPATDGDQPLFWQVTPYGLTAGGGSQDQLAGGLIFGGGVVNLVGFKVGGVMLHTGQQLVGYGGTPIEVGDFRFETDVSQSLLRLNVGATLGGFDSPYFLTGGVAYTDFLDDAAVDNYISPTAGAGLKFGRANLIRVGYRGDLGDGFDLHRLEAELRFAH